jgi:hypothetical protein
MEGNRRREGNLDQHSPPYLFRAGKSGSDCETNVSLSLELIQSRGLKSRGTLSIK